jgi:hypothetical protein
MADTYFSEISRRVRFKCSVGPSTDKKFKSITISNLGYGIDPPSEEEFSEHFANLGGLLEALLPSNLELVSTQVNSNWELA